MNTSTARPVRISFAMKDGVLARALKQVLGVLGNETSHVMVDDVNQTDLVIFSDLREIERTYDKEKLYAYLHSFGPKPMLPTNCVELDITQILPGLNLAIDRARKNVAQTIEEPVVQVAEDVSIQPDALRILIIDDTPKHRVSAKSGLAGHHLTVATGYEEAMEILARERFDAVLTDLHLPMSSKTLGDQAFKLGELVPYGILLMIEAARQGAKLVAVVTNLNHHADPFSAAFDHYSRFPITIEGAKVVMMHAPMNSDGAKNWVAALERLMRE